MNLQNNEIIIYTDGSCLGNPGKGGYCSILLYKEHEKILTEGFQKTTNNRMELLSVVVALESLKKFDIPIKVYTDSSYVVNSINKKWLDKWLKDSNFCNKKNKDLWIRFNNVRKLIDNFEIFWIKGHNNNYYNERCDQIAKNSANQNNLNKDYGYKP